MIPIQYEKLRIKGQPNWMFIVLETFQKTTNDEILKTPFQNSVGLTRKPTDPLYLENMGRRLSKTFFSFYKDKFYYNLTYLLQYDIL